MKFTLPAFLKKKKPFMVLVRHSDSKFDVENGSTIILYRRSIKYGSPSKIGLLTLQSGISLDIQPGFAGIVTPVKNLSKTGLVPTNSPRIILPGDKSEIEMEMWQSKDPYFTETSSYYVPYHQGDMIGYVQIVKIPKG